MDGLIMVNPHQLLQQLVDAGRTWSTLIVFLSSLVEYIFPPFPGDTVTLVAAVLVGSYKYSFSLLFTALFIGSILGTVIDYYAGRMLARHWSGSKRLTQATQKLERWGQLLVIMNRFFPGIRAFILVAAGMGKMGVLRVVILSSVSIFLWNGMIFGVGWVVGSNLDTLIRLFHTYSRWFYAGLVVLVLVVILRWILKRKQR